MSDEQRMEKVAGEILDRSAQCERDVVAVRSDGQAAIALVAPNSLLLATHFAEGVPVFDFWLN